MRTLPVWSMAQWQVPLLAEFWPESCSSLLPTTRKLASSPVALPLKLSTSQAANRYLRSGEKQIQSTVEISAPMPASSSSPLKGFQSKERMPVGVPEATKTRRMCGAEKLLVAAAARVAAEADITKSRRDNIRMARVIFADDPAVAPMAA